MAHGIARRQVWLVAPDGHRRGSVARPGRWTEPLALDLVLHPARYDVIVTSNLFGDILSDLAAALVGGLGLAPSANLHPGRHAMFEPVHGSAPDIAGQGIANPTATVLAGCMMLDHIGQGDVASRIRRAVEKTIREGRVLTRDLGGTATTDEFTDAVIAAL